MSEKKEASPTSSEGHGAAEKVTEGHEGLHRLRKALHQIFRGAESETRHPEAGEQA
jgi:hypothetical protein